MGTYLGIAMRLVGKLFALVVVVGVLDAGTAHAEKRVWTAKSGHRVIATMEDQTEQAVSLRIANRPSPIVVMIDELVEEDQAFVKKKLVDDQRIRISMPGAHTRRMENPLFADYVYRLNDRRTYALEARRAYNASKGPAVYYIGSMPDPMFPFGIGIQRGLVRQQPISPYFRYRPRTIFVDDYVPSFSD